jgi:hypothetical protein
MDFDSAAIAEYPSRESYLTMGADPEYIDRPGPPGRSCGLSVSHSNSGFCGAFPWSNRAPTARNGVFGPGQ